MAHPKLSDVDADDLLIAKSGFSCIAAGAELKIKSCEGRLYVDCRQGMHMLTGQMGTDRTLFGFTKKILKAA